MIHGTYPRMAAIVNAVFDDQTWRDSDQTSVTILNRKNHLRSLK